MLADICLVLMCVRYARDPESSAHATTTIPSARLSWPNAADQHHYSHKARPQLSDTRHIAHQRDASSNASENDARSNDRDHLNGQPLVNNPHFKNPLVNDQLDSGRATTQQLTDSFTAGGGAHAGLGLTLISNEHGRVRMRLDYRAELARTATHPVLHAAAIITAIDSAMGMTGMLFVNGASGIATLDLRYDEFSAPASEANVLVEAHCERLDGDILYITGSCMSEDGASIHARATGRFIRTAASSVQFMQPFPQAPLAARVVDGAEHQAP